MKGRRQQGDPLVLGPVDPGGRRGSRLKPISMTTAPVTAGGRIRWISWAPAKCTSTPTAARTRPPTRIAPVTYRRVVALVERADRRDRRPRTTRSCRGTHWAPGSARSAGTGWCRSPRTGWRGWGRAPSPGGRRRWRRTWRPRAGHRARSSCPTDRRCIGSTGLPRCGIDYFPLEHRHVQASRFRRGGFPRSHKLVRSISHPHWRHLPKERRRSLTSSRAGRGRCLPCVAWACLSPSTPGRAGSVRTERLLLRAPEARDREEFLDLGSDPVVNHHLGGGQDRATLEATLPAVPADRPAQYVMERDGRFLGWIGLSRREADRPGGSSVEGHGPDGVLEFSSSSPVHCVGSRVRRRGVRGAPRHGPTTVSASPSCCARRSATRGRGRLAERLGFTEVERFEEFGAAQWFGVRLPGWALAHSR